MIYINKYIYYLLAFIFCISSLNASSNIKLEKIEIDPEDIPSIRAGARTFFDKCQGCHGIRYMRYIDLALGLKINENKDKNLGQEIRKKLMHSVQGINENNPIISYINKEDAIKWFGKVPPDLSLVSRYRGIDWLYTYMKSFYKDQTKPMGINNLLFPDVGMPHVLNSLQGIQIYKNNTNIHENTIENMLELIEDGELSKKEYDALVTDLVAFLSYIGEPVHADRNKIGTNVMIFMFILVMVLYNLKTEYWKDID